METSYQQYFELHQLLRETSVSAAQPSYMLHRVIITELKVFLLFGAGNDGLLTKVYWFVLQTNNNNQFPLHKVIWQMLSVIPTKTLRIVSSPVLSLSSWLLSVRTQLVCPDGDLLIHLSTGTTTIGSLVQHKLWL